VPQVRGGEAARIPSPETGGSVTQQGRHTRLYREWVIIDAVWICVACGLLIAFGATFAIIAVIASYLFGYQTGQESEES
jgi:hypothetical protein